MSTVGGDQYLSLESKEANILTPEEERAHYRQRFLSMKLVLKELQQQLTLYKNRCAGVDSIALMLKESKEEIAKLTRQRKALETAIANLQNRLSTNGLSSSVNIEETELFVPGASKQTLDNLARENARLRTLLKSAEGQTGKKPSEDFQSMKASVEQYEAENNQLKAQLLEMENLKLHLASQYEEMIENLKHQHETERNKLEQELKQQSPMLSKENRRQSKDISDVEKNTVTTQTQEIEASKIDKLRTGLRQMSEQCLELHDHLENVRAVEKYDADKNNEKDVISRYSDLQTEFKQVVLMNQRWQSHNEIQTQEMHFLNAKITELQNLCRDAEAWKNESDAKDVENQKLRQEVTNLSQEANRRRSQPQFDSSLVEILKQQIQVCTEDFNTERKDRQQAWERAKTLEEELNRKKIENEALRKEVENLKKNAYPALGQPERREPAPVRQPLQHGLNSGHGHIRARGTQAPPQILPFAALSSQGSNSSPRLAPQRSLSMSPVPSLGPVSMGPASMLSTSSGRPPGSHDSGYVNSGHPPGRPQTYDYMSLPKSSQNVVQGRVTIPGILHTDQINASMPTLSKTSTRPDKEQEQYLTCPKCNKEFSEEEAEKLLPHINACTD